MDAPQYNPPPEDPTITALKARSQQDDIKATQETASIDTAALMARYGTRLAMAGASNSPLAVTPPPVAVAGR